LVGKSLDLGDTLAEVNLDTVFYAWL
jgi:hypothetical protein